MASDLQTRIRTALNQARKERDRFRTVVLGTVLSDLRNREIELGRGLEEADAVEVLARGVKQRRESAEQMRDGGRVDLAEKEEAEAELLTGFLPEQLSEDEVRAYVREIIAEGVDQLGPLMGRLMPRVRGRFDGSAANRIAREELEG